MCLQVLDAYIDTFDHVQEISLQHKRFPGVIQHPRRMLELLEILQSSADFVGDVKQLVLRPVAEHVSAQTAHTTRAD